MGFFYPENFYYQFDHPNAQTSSDLSVVKADNKVSVGPLLHFPELKQQKGDGISFWC